MFNIDQTSGIVTMNRGDTVSFTIHINQGDNIDPFQYKLKPQDNLYFAVEEPNQPFEQAILKKLINTSNNLLDIDGNITFNLESKDTQCLMPGLYYYEIKAKLFKGNEFRNNTILINFGEDNTYSIINEQTKQALSYGNYVANNNLINLEDTLNNKELIATIENNVLTFKTESELPFTQIKYLQERDIINTIIPQTKFILER